MNAKRIAEQLIQLDRLIEERRLDAVPDLAQTLLGSVLKAVYAQVRGQASTAEMRTLLELEIELGGESGDFRDFDNDRLAALFDRGKVFAKMDRHADGQGRLSRAVDLSAVLDWLGREDRRDPASTLAGLRFVSAWLHVLAREAGLADLSEPAGGVRVEPAQPAGQPRPTPPDPGKPFNEPVSGMTFVFVPGGSFPMGDTFEEGVDDEKPVHEVTLSPFFMAVHPVTQAQWARLMPDNPSKFQDENHPVEQVTLSDAAGYIDRLNASTADSLRFDLPSEAQWEYAARSGGKAELYAGGQDAEAVAWFEADAIGGTAAVGRKAPNGLGLYDMSGNVWEWCRDVYHAEAYRRHAKVDPVCTTGGTDRVIRGGSWHLDAWSARCSRRFRFDPELFGPALGFRLVMVVDGGNG